MEGYHKYIFNNGKFIGKFDEMYRNEAIEGYDSWQQDDTNLPGKQVALNILYQYNFGKVLDVGCGKGAFTHLLKRDNAVIGIDISKEAIRVAKSRYHDVSFATCPASKISTLGKFDLVVMMEVLSYLKDWEKVIESVAEITRYLFVSLWIPDNPIGFVKSYDILREEISKHYEIEVDIALGGDYPTLLLCKANG